ncbi:hypothetical protein ACIQTU_08615 [Brevundimonas sp. NPDC090276]|uniref:hypothetical protein n=1 Tax=Brevundimonas sp. NPDC090276 TaxID=3363956 RepID=UPI00383B7A57
MDSVQISIGAAKAASRWWDLIIPGLFALGGVALTNWVVIRHRKADAAEKKADRDAATTERKAGEARDGALSATAFVAHLENYALGLAKTVEEANRHDWDDNTFAPQWPPFSEWPLEIDWRLIGPADAAWARDLSMRISLIQSHLSSVWEFHEPDDYLDEMGEAAALLGMDAWTKAVEVRQRYEREPLTFDKRVWNFPAYLSERVALITLEREKTEKALADVVAAYAPKDV